MFGQVCRPDRSDLAKQIVVHRIVRFVDINKHARGFTPDVISLLQTDEPDYYLVEYCTTD